MAKAENAERRLLTGDAACGLTKAVKILVVLALLGLNSAHGVFGAITWLVGVSHSLLNLAEICSSAHTCGRAHPVALHQAQT